MTDIETTAGIAEEPGAVTRAVVGEQAADADAERAIVTDGSIEESYGGVAPHRGRGEPTGLDLSVSIVHSDGCSFGLSIGEDLGESHTGVVVDGDVHEFPAGAAAAVGFVGGDAMTGALEAAELLDIEM